ncbi:ATP-binding protein [bacterium]|nr:ATP-binding protein [bacterium]
MNIIPRILQDQVIRSLVPGKVNLIVGARRVGKTVLISEIMKKLEEPVLLLNGEDMTTYDLLKSRRIEQYRQLLQGKNVLIIDEAQKLENIGSIIKLIVDHIKNIKIILTGSSAFELGHHFGESLTGRKITFVLFTLAFQEFAQHENPIEIRDHLPFRMVFGGYPEVWQIDDTSNRISYLKELVNDYLFRDLLQLESIRNASKLKNLLRLISYQIGKEVSNQELGKQLGISKNTVDRYLDLLSRVFVIFKVQGFSRNLRKEIVKNHRWYFYDNGVLNVFLNNFNMPEMRQDVGLLWENYLIAERLKTLTYQKSHANTYFWRTYDQQEIDWIEEKDGDIHGFEMKWQIQDKKPPSAWKKSYPGSTYQVIHPENYQSWLSVGSC